MDPFTFYEGVLPPGFELDYEPAIFNLPAFAASQQGTSPVSFYLLDGKRKKSVAEIHFQRLDRAARSPFKAPFGSVECADHLNPKVLYRYLEKVERQLKEKGVTDIHIKNPPREYKPAGLSVLETFLLNRGYVVSDSEVGALIQITDAPFMDVIRPSEKLRMQQGRRAGFMFSQADLTDLVKVYDFIAQCHGEKGYDLSITRSELQKTASVFPERYVIFTVTSGGRLLAASVGIHVNKTILYNFLTNHQKKYNHLSPAIPLMEGIYNYCRHKSIKLFDLGTSALAGKPNFPLLDFKLHVGGRPTSKFSFHKKIG